MGGFRLEQIAKTNYENGQSLSEKICKIKGFSKQFTGDHYNEFLIKYGGDTEKLNKKLLSKNIQGGHEIKNDFHDLQNCLLFGITELYTQDDINNFITILKEVS